MRLHQRAVAGLAKRFEIGDLRRISDGVPELSLSKRCIASAFERTHEDTTQVAPLILDPPSILAREKHPPRDLNRRRGLRPSLVEIPRGQGCLSPLERSHSRVDIDRSVGGQRQLVAAEGAPQRARAVEVALLKQRAQLRRQYPECLLPGGRKVFAPQQLAQLVAWDRPPVLCRQVCEQDPTLPAREALLVNGRAVRLDRETVCQGDSNAQTCLPPSTLRSRALATR